MLQYAPDMKVTAEEAKRVLRRLQVRNVLAMLRELGHEDLAVQLTWREEQK